MASYPTLLERDWQHVRQRPPPLYEMPHMWQPNLHQWNTYHSSHCDMVQAGWRKWSAHHPDWYARRAESRHPDWYNRKTNYIREADIKNMMWTWDKTDKPTFKKTFGITREPPKPVQKGYQATPHDIQGQVEMPRWGLYHPAYYQEKSGVEPLPPLHSEMKHL